MTDSNAPLEALYPFLHGGHKDAAREQRALLESVARKAADSVAVKQRFFAEQAPALVDAARAIADAYRGGGRLFSMGNGGSACDAAHVAVEFMHPVTTGRPALAAISLDTSTTMLTAVGNDVGFTHVFARQLAALGKAGDVLMGFSTSGNSANLLAAFEAARGMGIVTIGLAGGDGGQMAKDGTLEHCLVVPTVSIHRVQETHVASYHIIWDLVHTLLADSRGALAP